MADKHNSCSCCSHDSEQHNDRGHDSCHDHCHHDHEHQAHASTCSCGHDHEHDAPTNKKAAILKYALGAVPIILGFMGFIPFYIPLIASVIGYLIFGVEVYVGMFKGFARGNIFTEFTLMCVATAGAFVIGEYADAAAVMYLYSLGECLSSSAYSSSKRNISELMEISPEYALAVRGEQIQRVAPEDVEIGELISVRTGERVALDGEVLHGGGTADTSSVTGESKPLELYEGVFCPSGSVLTEGAVTLRVVNKYENSVVSRLKRAVEEAGQRKSAAEKKITRFAAVFTPIAFAVAVLVFAVGALVTGNVFEWLKLGITVLVVSCPCSLVLSVPLTYFAGIGHAASEGIVFRGGEVMDRAANIDAIAFDKTGTLTDPTLAFDGAVLFGAMDKDGFLCLAKTVLLSSPHAAAISFCAACDVGCTEVAESVENISGRGVICTVGGRKAVFGNARLMSECGIEAPPCDTTCIYGAYNGVLVGRLDFSSHTKANAAVAISGLRALGVSRIAVISGDVLRSVSKTCEELAIDEYYYSAAPDEKLEIFRKFGTNMQKDKYTAYCGDGLNDSAVIAEADVGVAMGGCGSALTVESADIVLMDDDPEKIAAAIRIARKTSRVANSNIVLSLGIKLSVVATGVVLATFGMNMPIELAIVADVGAAVVAVLNSLRAAKGDKNENAK